METKSAKEKYWDELLDYLNRRPLLSKATTILDMEWMEMMSKGSALEDPYMLALQDRRNLPTKECVLLLFHFFRNCDKSSSNAQIADKVLVEIKKFWVHGNIPTQHVWWARRSIVTLNSKYLGILKHMKHDTPTEVKKREAFQSSLFKLFDIASPEAERELKKDRLLGKKKAEEDLLFLESQRTDRVAKMGAHDKKYDHKKYKNLKRKGKEEDYKASEVLKTKKQFEVVTDVEPVSDDTENNNDEDFNLPASEGCHRKRSDTVTLEVPRSLFNSPALTSILDRTQISSRKAVGLAASILKTAGADLREFDISHRTLHSQRDQHRSVLAAEAIAIFKANKPEHLAVHWDSKLVDDAYGTKRERLAVLVSGAPSYVEGKLLGVPSLEDDDGNATSTGFAQFKGACDLIKLWDVKNSVRGMVFDTTASNSGARQGACKRMEEWLERPVLWLACRHHVAEIMAKDCWYELYEDDLSPDNAFFVEFKHIWPELDTSSDTLTKKLNSVSRHLTELREEAIEFYQHILTDKDANNSLPRDDYRELAETSLIILGGDLPAGRKVVWHKPGATHKARFMAFGIYANKMFSFSDQLHYDSEMMAALKRFTQFFTLIFIPYFLKASVGADSPFTDLEMYKKLYKYRRVDSDLANKALAVLDRHGWYLTEQLVPFALFSNKVNSDIKSHIAARILTFHQPAQIAIGKPSFPSVKANTKLMDLVGEKSYLLFTLLGVGTDWLSKNPVEWEDDLDYLKAKTFCRTVKTVNDCAERGVKMITEYSKILTKDEKARDGLLQGVELNRKNYPDFSIKSLNK